LTKSSKGGVTKEYDGVIKEVAMLAVGDKAPLFKAPGSDGEVDLAALLESGPVVLYFFPRAMTSGCTAETLEFNQLLPEFEALGVTVVGTSVDPVVRLQKFRDKYDLKIPFASDEDRAIGQAYRTLKDSSTSSSHERDTVLISTDGTILLAYRKVSARGHAASVLNDARRLREEGQI
jgi:peroxiredoxin Q/BCP